MLQVVRKFLVDFYVLLRVRGVDEFNRTLYTSSTSSDTPLQVKLAKVELRYAI